MLMGYTQFLVGLLFVHWVTDFVLQGDDVALRKCNDNSVLLFHCTVYSFPLSLFFLIWGWKAMVISLAVLFVSHFTIDYVTSRFNKKFWLNNKRHEFFVMVGLDQFLHQAILLYLAMYFWG